MKFPCNSVPWCNETAKIATNSPSDVPSKVVPKRGITLILINEAANRGNAIIMKSKASSKSLQKDYRLMLETM